MEGLLNNRMLMSFADKFDSNRLRTLSRSAREDCGRRGSETSLMRPGRDGLQFFAF